MFTNQNMYFGMSIQMIDMIIVAIPCILVLVIVFCCIFIGLTTPEKTNGDQQKLMNSKNDVEENSEYGTVTDLKHKSIESNLSIKSTPHDAVLSVKDETQFRRSSDNARPRLTNNSSEGSLLSAYETFAEYFKIYRAAQNEALSILLSTKQADWVRIKDPGEDSIEYIEINKKRTFLLKAVVDARPDAISRIVFDEIDSVHQWSPKLTMQCTMLKRINANTHIVQTIITPGKVLKARDFVLLNHRTKMIVLGRESIVISSVSVDYDCPYLRSQQRSALIRGHNGPSCMVISPIMGQERSEIKWILNGDLGGWEPKKISDLALQTFLVRYMAALRERLINLEGHI
ncbi:hypothetical protein LSTR_LSTR017616 [Laodelphax striatellus]|uniref:START domain-containing protein n=1 Tax=Laodelphax striatellus TaxID=195883 RepID=A0A482WM19_LAOST|nr:hypothetical protein LSTR_LSTR017616 [Laodelphax striatellus]